MDDAVRDGEQRLASGEQSRGSVGATADESSGVRDGHPTRPARVLIAVGTAGALLSVAYAQGAFRWGGLGDVEVLGLLFGGLLLAYVLSSFPRIERMCR